MGGCAPGVVGPQGTSGCLTSGTFPSAGRVLLRKYRTAAWRQPDNMEASKKTSLCFCPGQPLGAGLGAAGPLYCK